MAKTNPIWTQMNSKPIIEVKELVKTYQTIVAVNCISFDVPHNICLGLLGPNGAGKTTTIEIIEGILRPTSGDVLYKGAKRTKKFREEIGIQFQSTELLSFLTVRESLITFKNLYQRSLPLDYLIDICRLEDILNQDNRKLSGGQKQRLLLAIALANDPELIILDEPTTGLDPQSRRYLWDIISNIKSQGKTIILTTHYMEEAQILCDDIIIMDKGSIIAQGAPNFLLNEQNQGVTISLPKSSVTNSPSPFVDPSFIDHPKWKVFVKPNSYDIQTLYVNDCLNALLQFNIPLAQMTMRSQNLEDLFIKLTGNKLQ